MTAPDAIIGKWKMDIDTKNKNLDGAVSYTMKQPFYLIFNPWCRGRETELIKEENDKIRDDADEHFPSSLHVQFFLKFVRTVCVNLSPIFISKNHCIQITTILWCVNQSGLIYIK